MNRLVEMSRSNGVYLCVGITEKMEENGSLYCSMVYISPENGLLGVHRKIKPTGTERLIWAEGGGERQEKWSTTSAPKGKSAVHKKNREAEPVRAK